MGENIGGGVRGREDEDKLWGGEEGGEKDWEDGWGVMGWMR